MLHGRWWTDVRCIVSTLSDLSSGWSPWRVTPVRTLAHQTTCFSLGLHEIKVHKLSGLHRLLFDLYHGHLDHLWLTLHEECSLLLCLVNRIHYLQLPGGSCLDRDKVSHLREAVGAAILYNLILSWNYAVGEEVLWFLVHSAVHHRVWLHHWLSCSSNEILKVILLYNETRVVGWSWVERQLLLLLQAMSL